MNVIFCTICVVVAQENVCSNLQHGMKFSVEFSIENDMSDVFLV